MAKPKVERYEGSDGNDKVRLKRVAAAMVAVLEDAGGAPLPEYADVKCVIYLKDEKMMGVQTWNYEPGKDGEPPELEAVVDLFLHMRAMFAAMGKEFSIAGIGKPVGRG